MTDLENHAEHAAFVGRILYASMFLLFGFEKVTNYGGSVGYMGSLGLPEPWLFASAAIVIEIFGALLMLVGYQTRLLALMLGIYLLVTAFIGHFQLGDPNQFRHFMKNIALVGGSLAFVACGAGAYSLDARRSSQGRSLEWDSQQPGE